MPWILTAVCFSHCCCRTFSELKLSGEQRSKVSCRGVYRILIKFFFNSCLLRSILEILYWKTILSYKVCFQLSGINLSSVRWEYWDMWSSVRWEYWNMWISSLFSLSIVKVSVAAEERKICSKSRQNFAFAFVLLDLGFYSYANSTCKS